MFKIFKSNLKSIKPGEDDFYIADGITVCPRAGFEINQQCPREYKLIIAECINNGWLKPVAHVTEKEYLWMNLSK